MGDTPLLVIVTRLFAVIPITFADFPDYFGCKHQEFLEKGVGEWAKVGGETVKGRGIKRRCKLPWQKRICKLRLHADRLFFENLVTRVCA